MNDEMPDEVDFTGGVRGKYYHRCWQDASPITTASSGVCRIGPVTSTVPLWVSPAPSAAVVPLTRWQNILAYLRVLFAVLTLALTGCATTAPPRVDQVSFDRGAFSLAYADFVSPMLAKCARLTDTASVATRETCVKLHTLDAQVRQAILDAPKIAAAAPAASSPLDQLMPLIMKLAPLAAGL